MEDKITRKLRKIRKTRVGVVVSDKMEKSAVVSVQRQFMHPIYGKPVRRSKKFKVHDEKNECKPGDLVRIMETRPVSKQKRWRLVEIIATEKE